MFDADLPADEDGENGIDDIFEGIFLLLFFLKKDCVMSE